MKVALSRSLRAALPALLFMGASCAETPPGPPPAQSGNLCREPRPQICMEIYMPVCGGAKDGSLRTYPNSCQACAHADVVSYVPGACEKE